jgi:tetratricopeptide (TPR) repeat protein
VAAGAAIAFAGCTPQNVREEKALRSQLGHELSHHSYESAIPLARRVIRMAPQDNRTWRKLVQAQIGLHDFEGAKQTLTDWRATVQPLSPRVDEFEGDIAHEEHDLSGALQAWGKAAAGQPKNRRILEKIALLEQGERHWPQAIVVWDRSIALHDNATARINRAVCHRCLRQWNEAFDDLHHAQKLAPNDPEVQGWSRLFENLSKYVEEIREFDARVAAIPNDSGLLADRALLLLRSGDPELALDDSEQAMKLAPWAICPRLFRGLALIALNRGKECESLAIRQPLRFESLTPEFLETINRIDSAISVERDNPEHYAVRAWQLNEIGQPLLAFEDGQNAVRLDPKSASGLAEISYALMKTGRGQEAFAKIKQATELEPNLATAWQYRGELEMSRGDNLAAIESLSRALSIQQTAAALQKREECYRRLGYRARAEDDHRAWLQLTTRSVR